MKPKSLWWRRLLARLAPRRSLKVVELLEAGNPLR